MDVAAEAEAAATPPRTETPPPAGAGAGAGAPEEPEALFTPLKNKQNTQNPSVPATPKKLTSSPSFIPSTDKRRRQFIETQENLDFNFLDLTEVVNLESGTEVTLISNDNLFGKEYIEIHNILIFILNSFMFNYFDKLLSEIKSNRFDKQIYELNDLINPQLNTEEYRDYLKNHEQSFRADNFKIVVVKDLSIQQASQPSVADYRFTQPTPEYYNISIYPKLFDMIEYTILDLLINNTSCNTFMDNQDKIKRTFDNITFQPFSPLKGGNKKSTTYKRRHKKQNKTKHNKHK